MWKYTGQVRPDFAETPGPDQESVWDYPRPPALVEDRREVVVRSGDTLVARSSRCYRVLETASPPTFYVPPEDVVDDVLVPCRGSSFCEWKGAARYWALSSAPDAPVGWDYPQPSASFAALRGCYSFYPARLVCTVDGIPVRPQEGGFYGGWVTPELVGPWKGAPGTGHW